MSDTAAIPAQRALSAESAARRRDIGVAPADLALSAPSRSTAGVARRLALQLEGGTGDRDYIRVAARSSAGCVPAGPGALAFGAEAGAGTASCRRYRSFALGGWGTLLGEPFRAWGGRRTALAALEYRLDVPFPAIPLGSFVSTGNTITAGAVPVGRLGRRGRSPGSPGARAGGVRPVAGWRSSGFIG